MHAIGKSPPVYTVFDLMSGASTKLVDRSGLMVIIDVGKHRSDWSEWSEVEPRIAEGYPPLKKIQLRMLKYPCTELILIVNGIVDFTCLYNFRAS